MLFWQIGALPVMNMPGWLWQKLRLPLSLKGQLEKLDIDWSRELSTVRIHVERVIGVLKQKYTILQSILPITLIPDYKDSKSTIDKIVQVCCVCVNLCPSVVFQE